MYPQRELALLTARKEVLRKNIALRRTQCAQNAARVAKPLAWLDRLVDLWRRIPPLAKIAALPLGLLVVKRTFFRRQKTLGPLLRWGPLVLNTLRSLSVPRKIRPSKSLAENILE